MSKFDLWWQMVTDEDNVHATLTQLPDAWDGAINYQMQSGTGDSDLFDMEPLTVTYLSIGLISQPKGKSEHWAPLRCHSGNLWSKLNHTWR